MADTTTKPKPDAKPKPAAKRPAIRGGKAKGGAAALLAAAPPAPAADLPLELLDPTFHENPRGDVDETDDEFAELLASVEANGLLQPIVVGPALVEGGKHPIIAGWRRYHVLRKLKAKSAPVKQTTITDPADALAAAIAENRARKDITPLAEARAIRKLMDEHGLTQVQAGRKIGGMSERTVRERLLLLKLPDVTAAAIDNGTIPMELSRKLQAVASVSPDAADQLVLLVTGADADSFYTPGTLSDADLFSEALRETEAGASLVTVARTYGGEASAVHVYAHDAFEKDDEAKLKRRLDELRRAGIDGGLRLSTQDLDEAKAAGLTCEIAESVLIADLSWLRPRLLAALERAEAQAAEHRKANAAAKAAAAAAAPAREDADGMSDEQRAEAFIRKAEADRLAEIALYAAEDNVRLGDAIDAALVRARDAQHLVDVLVLLSRHSYFYVALGLSCCFPEYTKIAPDRLDAKIRDDAAAARHAGPDALLQFTLRGLIAMCLADTRSQGSILRMGIDEDAELDRLTYELAASIGATTTRATRVYEARWQRAQAIAERDARHRVLRVLRELERAPDRTLPRNELFMLSVGRDWGMRDLGAADKLTPGEAADAIEQALAEGFLVYEPDGGEDAPVVLHPMGNAAIADGLWPRPGLADVDPAGPPADGGEA